MQVLNDGYNLIVIYSFSVSNWVDCEDGRLAYLEQRGLPTVAKKNWSLKNKTLQGVNVKHTYGVTQRVTELWQS